jgi:hypothetical protein
MRNLLLPLVTLTLAVACQAQTRPPARTQHGLPGHQIFAARIQVHDEQTRAWVYSDKQVMTYHIYPKSDQAEAPHDAAYEAFVKMYSNNSKIAQQYDVCLPRMEPK